MRYFAKEKLLREKAEAQALLREKSPVKPSSSGLTSEDESSENDEHLDWKSDRMAVFGSVLRAEKNRI